MQPSVHSLYTYPIKSCRGIALQQAELGRTGIGFDRHWMLVNKQGQFLSQRKFPRMALIETRLTETDHLLCTTPSGRLQLPLNTHDGDRVPVQIWNDQCSAARVSTQASRWFSDFLHTECELVCLPDNERRRVDTEYAHDGQTVAFADGFPLLVVSLASVRLLGEKLGQEISVERFRPNIVLDGCEPHQEDDWKSITINGIEIELAKPCSRCVIPSIDQRTAEKHPTLLSTLAGYRRIKGKVYVGQNGLHTRQGHINVGDRVSFKRK